MMLKKSYIYLILTVVALLAAACSKAPELTEPSVPVPDMTNLITFDMLGTKVTNDDIRDEEFIIYDYVGGVQYIDGSEYTLKYSEDEDAWRFYDKDDPENAVDFYWTESGTHEFFAYNKVDYYSYELPYDEYKAKFDFSYEEERLRTTRKINMLYYEGMYEDLICAKTTRVVEEDGYAPVEIHFNHMFASVKVTFRNNSLTDKTISDISLTNLYCSTGAGSYLYFDGSYNLSWEDANPYEFSVSQEVPDGTEWDAFGTVIVLPQALGGMTEEVVWHEDGVEKRLRIYNDLGTNYWDAGRLYHYVITLDPTELILEPTATIEHTEDAGGNKFSVVNVNLNAPDEELQRITSLLITVTDPESNVIKTYEAATVVSNEISMECDELLNPGTYTVSVDYSVAYHDGSESLSDSMTVVLEDTAVQPALGYYVNSDGTFSETFISSSSNASGYSIAKIFYIEDPSEEDTQLEVDYPYCTRGLAYEVDSSTGNIKITTNVKSWNQTSSRQKLSSMDDDYISYSSTDNIHGYSNTVAIKESYNQGFISYGTESAVIANVTSSWYIPSVGEFNLIDKAVFGSTLYVWTSTVGHYQMNAWASHEYYACYIIISNGSIVPSSYNSISAANGAYVYQPYFRILAF